MKINRKNKGFIVLMLTITILTLTFFAILAYFKSAYSQYEASMNHAKHTKAKFLAQSGLEATLMLFRRINIDMLYRSGFFPHLPTLPLGGGLIDLEITEETGKINVNRLLLFTDEVTENEAVRGMLNKLSDVIGFPYDIWDGVVDYIDKDNLPKPKGYEKDAYSSLQPPRRIKNNRLHSIDELLLIPGFSRNILYQDLRTDEEKREFNDVEFKTEEEKLAITNKDFILANNITTYLPRKPNLADKININWAPYHVILSIHEFITPSIAKKIIVERLKNGGRFKSKSDLKKIKEMNTNMGSGSLYQYIENYITTEDKIYKIVAEASLGSQTAHVKGVYDKTSRRLIYYWE